MSFWRNTDIALILSSLYFATLTFFKKLYLFLFNSIFSSVYKQESKKNTRKTQERHKKDTEDTRNTRHTRQKRQTRQER